MCSPIIYTCFQDLIISCFKFRLTLKFCAYSFLRYRLCKAQIQGIRTLMTTRRRSPRTVLPFRTTFPPDMSTDRPTTPSSLLTNFVRAHRRSRSRLTTNFAWSTTVTSNWRRPPYFLSWHERTCYDCKRTWPCWAFPLMSSRPHWRDDPDA